MPTAKRKRDYPRTVKLDDKTEITLRLMTASDADRIMAFARALPEQDLLFLRADITDPRIVAQWVQNIAAERTVTVVAEAGGNLAGYLSLHYNQVKMLVSTTRFAGCPTGRTVSDAYWRKRSSALLGTSACARSSLR